MIADSPWSVRDAARLLGISPGNTTRRVVRIGDRTGLAVLAEPSTWAETERPDRIVDAAFNYILYAGRLANRDPNGFRRWLQKIVEQRLASQRR